MNNWTCSPIHVFMLRSAFRGVTAAVLCISALLTGCATPAVLDEAKGQVNTIDKIAVLRITNAYRENAGDRVMICMIVRDLQSNTESEMTLNIPMQRNRWDVRLSLSDVEKPNYSGQLPQAPTSTYVGFQPAAKDLSSRCQARGNRLPVFNLGTVISPYGSNMSNTDTSFRLPKGMSEAVYTISQKNDALSNFGYVSTNQIVENAYSIDVSAYSMTDMRTMKNQKPYLYLLTPVAVAVDTVTITVGVVFAALLDPRTYVSGGRLDVDGE